MVDISQMTPDQRLTVLLNPEPFVLFTALFIGIQSQRQEVSRIFMF